MDIFTKVMILTSVIISLLITVIVLLKFKNISWKWYSSILGCYAVAGLILFLTDNTLYVAITSILLSMVVLIFDVLEIERINKLKEGVI